MVTSRQCAPRHLHLLLPVLIGVNDPDEDERGSALFPISTGDPPRHQPQHCSKVTVVGPKTTR